MLRKRYLDVEMGPVSQHQLTIAPAFYAAFVDLDGPYSVTVPGFEKQTRARHVISAKVWIMTFACPMTKLCNLQVIESKSSEGILEGFTRFACENGMSKYFLLDQETSFMKAVRDVEIDLVDVDARAFKEHGVHVEVAPVSGHNYSGLVERKIRSVQETFEKIGVKSTTIHATGLQTLCKLVETHLNNIPLGFAYGRSANNSPILKLVTPNLLKIGRINSRCLDGPLYFPNGPKDLMVKIENLYNAFFKVWNVSVLPTLIPQPKWFKSSPEVKVNNVVYFQKSENDLNSKWTVGQIDSVQRSKDGAVRRAYVRYYNYGEDAHRITDRCVRSLVRLFNVEDNYWVDEMAKCEMLVKELRRKAGDSKVEPLKLLKKPNGEYEIKSKQATYCKSKKCKCCCVGHCKLIKHCHQGSNRMKVNLSQLMKVEHEEFEFPHIYEQDLLEEESFGQAESMSMFDSKDPLYEMMMAMETNFSWED